MSVTVLLPWLRFDAAKVELKKINNAKTDAVNPQRDIQEGLGNL